jgi:hypothetical protein
MKSAKHLVSQCGYRSFNRTHGSIRCNGWEEKVRWTLRGTDFRSESSLSVHGQIRKREVLDQRTIRWEKVGTLSSQLRRCSVTWSSKSPGWDADFHNWPRQKLREPNQAPVIHSLFIVLVIHGCLSTHILGIIAARAVPPSLFQEPCQGSESGIRVENGVWEIRS